MSSIKKRRGGRTSGKFRYPKNMTVQEYIMLCRRVENAPTIRLIEPRESKSK